MYKRQLGNVSGYINSLDGPVEDAYLTLNNKTTFSDSNGFFEFKDCIKKNSVFTISHPEFSEYSNSINVTDSINLNIALTRIKYDYFPLKVGNHWTYFWNNSGGAHPPGVYWHSEGTLQLNVISAAGIYPNYTYRVKETRYDSTNNYTNHHYFNIQSNNSDSIFVSESSYLIKRTTIRRLREVTDPDTVLFFGGYEGLETKLKRNIGIVYVFYGFHGITYSNVTSFRLFSCTLN